MSFLILCHSMNTDQCSILVLIGFRIEAKSECSCLFKPMDLTFRKSICITDDLQNRKLKRDRTMLLPRFLQCSVDMSAIRQI